MKTENSTNLQKHMTTNSFKRWALDRFHRTVKEMLPASVQRVLDVGCGEGFSAQAILDGPLDIHYHGGDMQMAALQMARRIFPGGRYIALDAARLPLCDNSYDLVLSLEVLEHLPNPAQVLREYQRVAREYLLLSVPHEPFYRMLRMLNGQGLAMWGDHPEHIQHWSLGSFKHFVEQCGFSVQQARSPFPFVWSILLCRVSGENANARL